MVKVTITLRFKRQVWFVVAYDVDSADVGQPLSLPRLLKRKFISHEAAINYVQRMVFGRLKLVRNDAVASAITCDVNVLPTEEKHDMKDHTLSSDVEVFKVVKDRPIAYCRTCLIQIAMAGTSEDRTRLQALLGTWTPGGELIQRRGYCARCGEPGELGFYSEATPSQ